VTDATVIQPAAAPAPAAAADAPMPTLAQAVTAAEAQAKPLLRSRTIWSLIVVAGATAAQHLGYQFADSQQSALLDAIMTVVQGGGLTAAALFRVVAAKQLT
jgi:hypothetical protein